MKEEGSSRIPPAAAVPIALLLVLFHPAGYGADSDLSFGGVRTALNLTTSALYTDNFYYEPDNGEPVLGATLRPEVTVTTEAPKAALNLVARGEYGVFDASGSHDDYLDSYAGLKLGLTPTYRNRFFLDGALNNGHDAFGVNRTEGATFNDRDLDQWRDVTGGTRYRYGAPGATLNAELGVSTLDRSYRTNRYETAPLDFGSTTVDYTVYYNYSPKTAALASFSRSDIDFDRPLVGTPTENRNGHTYQALAGIKWLATAKTSGDVRAGVRRRTFDDDSTAQLQGFDWQAGVQWSPSVPTVFELRTGRSEQQSYRLGTRVIDTKHTSLSLTRTLSPRAKVKLAVDQTRAGFFGSPREDEVRAFNINFDYWAGRFNFLFANLGYVTRDSNDGPRDYSRLAAVVGIRTGR